MSRTKPDPEVFLRAAALLEIGSPDTLKGADALVPGLAALLSIRGALGPL